MTKSASAPPKDQKSTKKEKVEKAKETAPKNQSSNAKSATEGGDTKSICYLLNLSIFSRHRLSGLPSRENR